MIVLNGNSDLIMGLIVVFARPWKIIMQKVASFLLDPFYRRDRISSSSKHFPKTKTKRRHLLLDFLPIALHKVGSGLLYYSKKCVNQSFSCKLSTLEESNLLTLKWLFGHSRVGSQFIMYILPSKREIRFGGSIRKFTPRSKNGVEVMIRLKICLWKA